MLHSLKHSYTHILTYMQKREYECAHGGHGTAGYHLSSHIADERRHHAWANKSLDLHKPKERMVLIADRLVRYMCYFGAGEEIVCLVTAFVANTVLRVLEKRECQRVCVQCMGVQCNMSGDDLYALFERTYASVSNQLLLLCLSQALTTFVVFIYYTGEA